MAGLLFIGKSDWCGKRAGPQRTRRLAHSMPFLSIHQHRLLSLLLLLLLFMLSTQPSKTCLCDRSNSPLFESIRNRNRTRASHEPPPQGKGESWERHSALDGTEKHSQQHTVFRLPLIFIALYCCSRRHEECPKRNDPEANALSLQDFPFDDWCSKEASIQPSCLPQRKKL